MAAGGKAINLGELAIAIALKTGALEAGLKEVQNKLKDHGKKVQATGADYDKLAIGAGVAFAVIGRAISGGVKAFNDFNNSMVGLKSIVQGTGNSFQEAQGFIDDYIKDGLIPASDAATALKNLLARGFGLGEASTILTRFKDSAAFGRQASLSLGEAVKSATEGLKNENSILVDNAGVTKNVSVMWKEYAVSIGKGVDSLTIAEKRQAELNGIVKETRFQIGDAAKYSAQFAGAQAKAAAESKKLNQAFGGSLTPALGALLNVITPVISALTSFVKGNPELVATLTLTATAFLGIITVITSLRAAIVLLGPAIAALKLSLAGLMINPVVLGLTALAAVGGIVATQVMKAKKAQDDYSASLERYNRIKLEGIQQSEVAQLTEERDILKTLVSEYDKVTKQIDVFNKEQEKINNGTLKYNDSMGNRSNILFDLIDKQEELNKQLKENNVTFDEAKERIEEYTKAIEMASLKTGSYYNDQAKDIAQRNADIQVTNGLIKAYNTAEKGSTEWRDAEKKLAEQFPQFATASGIKIDAIEKVNKTQQDAVELEWKVLIAEVQMTKIKVAALLVEKQAALDVAEAERAALMGPGDARHYSRTGMSEAMKQKVTDTNNAAIANRKAVNSLTESQNILNELLKSGGPGDIGGVMPLA